MALIENDEKKANCCRDCILGMDLLARRLPDGRGKYRTYSGSFFTIMIFLLFWIFIIVAIVELNDDSKDSETVFYETEANIKSTGYLPMVQYYEQTKYGHYPVDEVVPVVGQDDEKLFNFAVGLVDPEDTSVDYSSITPDIGKLEIYYRKRFLNNNSESTALFTYEHINV